VAYDYAGSFTDFTAHASNLFPSTSDPPSTPFSTQQALQNYLSAGVPSSKIILGMPLYGRSFLQTVGLGQPYHGVGDGSWPTEPGTWDFKALPLHGATDVYDREVGGSYSHTNVIGSGSQDIVSYDNKETAQRKAEYIVQEGLGGGMWWESSGDKAGDDSLIGTVAQALDHAGSLDKSQNWLEYPTSRYENMRNGMMGE
jgi:chitinase